MASRCQSAKPRDWHTFGLTWFDAVAGRTIMIGTLHRARLPFGKHTKNDETSPFSMGKSTISMAMFNSYFDITRG